MRKYTKPTSTPTQQTKIHILNPTRPTDNPINSIRDLNPKNIKLLTKQKQISK